MASNMQKMLRDGLMKVDPENADVYEKNAEEYISKLQELHDSAVEKFNKIPKEKRILVTSEGAFKYFSAAYGFPSRIHLGN